MFAWCVRLSRLLVGFRTHFKSLHFHSFHSLIQDRTKWSLIANCYPYAFTEKMHFWTCDFWPHLVSLWPWPLTLWPQKLTNWSLFPTAPKLWIWSNSREWFVRYDERFVRHRVKNLWNMITQGQPKNKTLSVAVTSKGIKCIYLQGGIHWWLAVWHGG